MPGGGQIASALSVDPEWNECHEASHLLSYHHLHLSTPTQRKNEVARLLLSTKEWPSDAKRGQERGRSRRRSKRGTFGHTTSHRISSRPSDRYLDFANAQSLDPS